MSYHLPRTALFKLKVIAQQEFSIFKLAHIHKPIASAS
jgi:hypothetical protein